MSEDDSKESDQIGIRKDRVDQVSAILWVVLGIIVLIGAQDLKYKAQYGPGPGFLPFWLGLGIILLGLMLLARSIFGRKHKDADELLLPNKHATIQLLLVMGGVFSFVFLAEKVGFLLGIGLLFFFILTFVEKRPWKFSLAISLFFTLVYWTVFEFGLQLRLPLGFLDLLQ